MFLTLHPELRFDVRRLVKRFLVRVIPDRYVGAGLGERVSHCQTDASAGSRHDCRPALKGEEGHHKFRVGNRRVVVGEMACFGVCHLVGYLSRASLIYMARKSLKNGSK